MGDVGTRLKNLRLARNKTQQELADVLGITRDHVSRMESNTRNINTNQLIKIARFLDVTLDYFDDKPDDKRLFETLTELSNFFSSEGIPDVDKDKAYQSIMAFYLKSKEKGREEQNEHKLPANTDGGNATLSEKFKQ